MLFISYNISGLGYFAFIAIPIAGFALYYLVMRKRGGEKFERSRTFQITSKVIALYVLVFFSYLFFIMGRGR